jgi:hypothetical protein
MFAENVVLVPLRHAASNAGASPAVLNSLDAGSIAVKWLCGSFPRGKLTTRRIQINRSLCFTLIPQPALFIGLLEGETIKFVDTLSVLGTALATATHTSLDAFLAVDHAEGCMLDGGAILGF